MKRNSPCTYQSYSPSSRSTKQIRESFRANGHLKGIQAKNKRNSVQYATPDLKQAKEKLEAELLILKDVIIFRIVTAKILYTKQNQKKKSRKLYFRSGNKIYIQSRLNLKGLAKRPKTSLKVNEPKIRHFLFQFNSSEICLI